MFEARPFMMRSLCLFVAGLTFMSASANGIVSLSLLTAEGAQRVGNKLFAPQFTQKPKKEKPAPNPGKNEKHRGGIWNDRTLAAEREIQFNRALRELERNPEALFASIGAAVAPAVLALQGAPNGGAPLQGIPFPWEGEIQLGRPDKWEDDIRVIHDHGGREDWPVDDGGFGDVGGGGGIEGGGGADMGGGGMPYWGGAGASINPTNGNVLTGVPIVGWSARGESGIQFTLAHNSRQNTSFAFGSDMGRSWTHSYSIRVDHSLQNWNLSAGFSVAVYEDGDGMRYPFTYTGPNQNNPNGLLHHFTPPSSVYSNLYWDGSSQWRLLMQDGSKVEFDNSGQVTSITDRHGNAVTVNRSGSEITTVTDGTGRSLQFLYTNGRISSVTAPDGKTFTFTRDSSDNLTQVTYPSLNGQTIQREFAYDGAHKILTHRDLNGQYWSYTYATDTTLLSFTEPTGSQWSFSHQPSKVQMFDPAGKKWEYSYTNGKLWSAKDPDGFQQYFTGDANSNLTSYTDKRGMTWNWSYDASGNQTSETDPLGRTSSATYNSHGQPLTVTDSAGATTTIQYTNPVQPWKVIDHLGRTQATLTYNSLGEVTAVADHLGRVSTVDYNSYGDVTQATGIDGNVATATYDLLGRPLTTTGPNGVTVTLTRDDWKRATSVTVPGIGTSSLTLDAMGRVLSATDALGRTGSATYDAAGRQLTATNAKGETHTTTYDLRGLVTGVQNARGFTRTYTYSNRGDLLSQLLPDGALTQWSYDGEGNVTLKTDPLGIAVGYVYNDAGENILIDYPTGTDTEFTYDAAGRTSSMVDSTGTSSWTYDILSQVTSLTTPQGAMTYAYNALGQATQMVDAAGTTTYTYDSLSRPLTLTNQIGETTTTAYNSLGQVLSVAHANGTTENYTYDSLGRLTSSQLKSSVLGPSNVIESKTYTYNAGSQIVTATEAGVTRSYTYDLAGQLATENHSTGYWAAYTYDANGNRLSKNSSSGTETYVYDSADKLLSVSLNGAPWKAFTYDGAGRTTSQSGPAGARTFAYDFENRVTAMVSAAGTETHSYNGLDARVGSTGPTGAKTFRRAGIGATSPVLSDGSALFTPGISEHRNGVSTWSHGGLKNTDGQTGVGATALSAAKVFDAFGNTLSSTGVWKGPFGYGGAFGYQSDDSGLQLLGHRYYDPSLGRFVTKDPLEDGRNWYAYCGNDPINRTDPNGLEYMVFDGSTLTMFEDNGTPIWSVPAYSGKPGTTSNDQRSASNGPIPEGEYYINPSEIGWNTNLIAALLSGPDFIGPAGAWGKGRVPLHPRTGTNTHKRGGFFLHGGDVIGSAGCIDVGHNEEFVLKEIRKRSKGKKMKVFVKYKKRRTVPGTIAKPQKWGGHGPKWYANKGAI